MRALLEWLENSLFGDALGAAALVLILVSVLFLGEVLS